jgi:hypothetical protein
MFFRPLLPVKNIYPEKAASVLSHHRVLIFPHTALRKGFQAVLSHGKGQRFFPSLKYSHRSEKNFCALVNGFFMILKLLEVRRTIW